MRNHHKIKIKFKKIKKNEVFKYDDFLSNLSVVIRKRNSSFHIGSFPPPGFELVENS